MFTSGVGGNKNYGYNLLKKICIRIYRFGLFSRGNKIKADWSVCWTETLFFCFFLTAKSRLLKSMAFYWKTERKQTRNQTTQLQKIITEIGLKQSKYATVTTVVQNQLKQYNNCCNQRHCITFEFMYTNYFQNCLLCR